MVSGSEGGTRTGVSLAEILMALTILGLFLLVLANANYVLARKVYPLSGGAARDGEIAAQVSQFLSLPYDSLAGRSGTRGFPALPWPFTRTVAVDTSSPSVRRITLTLTPANAVFRPYRIVLIRTNPAAMPASHP